MVMMRDPNIVQKKYLTKIVSNIIKKEKYHGISKVEIFFVFGSKVRTAMCDWVFGMKVYTTLPTMERVQLVNQLKLEVRRKTDSFFKQSFCCTDVVFETPI